MKIMKQTQVSVIVFAITASGLPLAEAIAGDHCSDLGLGNNKNAIHAALQSAVSGVAPDKVANGGLGNQMWATLVDRDGIVCAVAFTISL